MIDQLVELINEFGIDGNGLKGQSVLGESGLGLDSQEIVDLECMAEQRFKVTIPPRSFNKETKGSDIIALIKELQVTAAKDVLFEGKSEAFIDMDCSHETAFNAIYKMEEWPEKLPHVERIEVLYNDGVYQEFLMDVLSESGTINVRSVRRCEPFKSILFFQPTPPAFLKNHCGGWKFYPIQGGCRVTTWHQWNINQKIAAKKFQAVDSKSTEEQIEELLLDHAKLALDTWKQRLRKE